MVQMGDPVAADRVVRALHGQPMWGQEIVVKWFVVD